MSATLPTREEIAAEVRACSLSGRSVGTVVVEPGYVADALQEALT